MEWFRLRENLAKKILIVIRKWLWPSSIALAHLHLPKTLKEIIEFLLREKYLIALEEKQAFNTKQPFYYVGFVANLNREATSGHFLPSPLFSHATELKCEQAFSRALGEFVERYSFLVYSELGLKKHSIQQLKKGKKNFVNPQKVVTLNASFVKDRTEFLWAEAVNFCSGNKVLLPGQMIFWNYNIDHKRWSEPLLRERNSCGLASGFSYEVAVRNALYELIQRDAFFVFWYNHLSPEYVEIDSTLTRAKLRELIDWCSSQSIKVDFFNITADIPVPSFLCVLQGSDNEKPILSLGMGSGFDTEANLEAALIEAIGLFRWTIEAYQRGERIVSFDTLSREPDWQQKFAGADRILTWSRKDMWPHLSFLLSGKKKKLSEIIKGSRTFSDIHSELQLVKDVLSKLGPDYEPLVYASNHPLAKQLSSNAVRVFVPALVPMFMEESGSVIHKHPRIKDVPEKIGFKARKEVYPYPHPFP